MDRGRIVFCNYSFAVEYVPGKKNVIADAMSRLMAMNHLTKDQILRGPRLIKRFHGRTNAYLHVIEQ